MAGVTIGTGGKMDLFGFHGLQRQRYINILHETFIRQDQGFVSHIFRCNSSINYFFYRLAGNYIDTKFDHYPVLSLFLISKFGRTTYWINVNEWAMAQFTQPNSFTKYHHFSL